MKNYRYIILGILMSWTLGLSARTFTEGEELYLNAQQSFNWGNAGAKLMLYLYNGGDPMWLDLEYVDGSFYKAVFPAACTYNKVTVVRKNPTNPSHNFDGDVWNKKEDMDLVDTWNCLDNFDDASNRWKLYAPPATAVPSATAIAGSGVTEENIQICASAWSGPFSLRVKLNSDSTAYNYSDVTGHGWYYSYDGATWTALDPAKTGIAANDLDNKKDMNKNMLPAKPVGEEIYYYLHSSVFSGRRLMHLTTDAPKCDLDCSITSFETAVSNVNADDNTYTLDGIVAFGVPNGSLKISCGTASITIPSPKSPQSFSLNNLPATDESGQTATVTASFTGDDACIKAVDFDVPNVVEAVEIIRIDTLTGVALSLLSPTAEADNDYVWVDDKNVEHRKSSGQAQSFDVPAFATDGTKEYIYKEYYELSGNMDDLMANGNYESGTPMSDYDNWGTFPQTSSSQIEFYENDVLNPLGYKENGFAIVQNAHNFYSTYAAVTAKEGSNFALFDAKTGNDGGNKKAWYATTAESTNLKLKKGTRYVLSFWAANINNYGEMDNAARFKFYIEDITDPANPVRIDSSDVLDLSIPEFRNNIWHQCSETFYAKQNCNNVRISVVNLNTNDLNVGNDFALDDIQFHAISTVTKVVKSQQKFVVVAHEPKIDAFTATVVPLLCDGGPAYTVKMHAEFQNPKGKLVIRNKTTGVDSVYTVSAPWDTPTEFDRDFIITTDQATHEWEAFFEDWTSAKKTASTAIPGFPKIEAKNFSFSDPIPTCGTLTTLTFDLDYTYQQGKLHYSIDGIEGEKIKTITTDKSKQTLSGLTFEGIPADGQVRTLHVSFDGANSCTKDFVLTVPTTFSPVIDDVQISGLPTGKLSCDTTSYEITVQVTTHYNAVGHNIVLKYDDNGTLQSDTVPAAGSITTKKLTLHNMDKGAQTITASLEEAPLCTRDANYTAPMLSRITPLFDVNVSKTACDVLNYTVSGTVNYDMADGDLIVEYDATHRHVISVAPGSTSANFSIPYMTDSGDTLTLTAWFTGSAIDPCKEVSKTFASPTVPTIDTLNVSYAAVGCTDVNTTLTFDLDYTYQQGTLSYWVDTMTSVKQTATYTDASAKADTLKGLTFANIPADGKTHVLHVSFDGSNSCVKDYTLPATPFSPVINEVQISGVPATVLCDEMSYTATVSVSMPYDATGKDIVLTYEGTTKTVAVSGNPTVTVLTLTSTDTSGLTVSAAYNDSPACSTTSSSYTAPTRWNCIKDQVSVCEGESYIWSVTGLTYGPFNTIGKDTIASSINVYDSLFVTVQSQPEISIPDIDTLYDDITVIRVPYVVTKGTPNKFVCTVNGVVSTHAKTTVDTIIIAKPASVTTGDYTIDIDVIDSTFTTCHTTIQKKVHIAGIPSVSTLTVKPREIACGGSSYVVDVHAVYQNPRSALLVKDKTNGITYTYVVPTVTTVPYNTPQTIDTVITIASMTPATLEWEAFFTGWTGSNATSVAPTVPSMQINAVTPSAPACSKVSDVTFDVDYIYQQGQMQYKVDGMAAQTQAITSKNAGSLNSGTLTVSNVPADGKTHKLYVTFDGANSCQDSVEFTAPLSQVIDDVQITGIPATILCDEMSYTATVSILMPYDATGKDIVLAYEGTTKTVAVSGNPTVTMLTLTTADASGLTINAAYSDSPTCSTTSSSYTAPTRWTCDRDSADICLGESYLWHGTSFSPVAAGTYGYKDNYDSLYLTVHAEPAVTMLPAAMICADENEIRLPFAVTSGMPNKFDIAIGGHTFTQAAGLTDTIVIARPSDIPAGSYTATITVRDSLVNCFSTAKTNFVIAQPDLMYRKWNDVVFVDNSSNQFVSYQWYESGSGVLNGETQQYLHDDTGLSGTYYCQIVTTANDTLYTCPIAFDDIIPSRDVTTGSSYSVSVTPTYVRSNGTISIRQEEAQELTIMVYNATGILTGLYTQNETYGTIKAPEQNGVYIVYIHLGESVHTTKIIVHE